MTARVIVVATGQLGRPGPAGGVDSVNGETGDVVLDAGDVDAEPAGAVATHAAVTTSVHGVADMTLLETLSGATAKANAAQTAATTAAAVDATTKANTAQSAAATNAATQIAAHAVAADPHADRAYTDAQIAASLSTAFDFKASVRVATTGNITLSGEQTIDGVAVVAGNRVLAKNQTTGSQNGIHVAAAGAWSRATDADISAEVTAGMSVPVEEGTVSAGLVYLLTTPNPITLGTTALSFSLVGSGDLKASNNLSDVTSPATALTNLGGASATELNAHEIETTFVHGITNTAVLETVSGSAAKVAAHEIDTTSIHGIANTAFLETQAGAQIKVDTLEDALPAIYIASANIRTEVLLTQAAYDALGTKVATTRYNITDASPPLLRVDTATVLSTTTGSVALDFDVDNYRTHAITGNIVYTTANRASGKFVVIKVLADASTRTLTFPVGWKFVGNKPINIAATKTGILTLRCFGSADTDIVAAWAVEL